MSKSNTHIYNLTKFQLEKFKDLHEYILLKKEMYDRIKKNRSNSNGVLQNIFNGIDYNIYKINKSKHIDLWTGLVSKNALIEYLEANSEGRLPNVTAEHFYNRKRIIHNILEGDLLDKIGGHYYDLIEYYFNSPGAGKFHITTKSENSNLVKFQENISINHQEQYKNAGIDLYPAYKCCLGGIFNKRGVSFWLYPDIEIIYELIKEYNIINFK